MHAQCHVLQEVGAGKRRRVWQEEDEAESGM